MTPSEIEPATFRLVAQYVIEKYFHFFSIRRVNDSSLIPLRVQLQRFNHFKHEDRVTDTVFTNAVSTPQKTLHLH
jgi:hypothetical protein